MTSIGVIHDLWSACAVMRFGVTYLLSYKRMSYFGHIRYADAGPDQISCTLGCVLLHSYTYSI